MHGKLATPRQRLFCISVAGLVVGVHARNDTARAFCRDYLCEGSPDFSATITEEDLQQEAVFAAKADVEEGREVSKRTDNELEYTAIHRKICEQSWWYGVLMFHGAAIEANGKGVLFCAKSGTGKSTHILQWKTLDLPDFRIINGDKPFVKVTDGGIYLCGTPWMGKERFGINATVPLDTVVTLRRGKEDTIAPSAYEDVVKTLFEQSYGYDDKERLAARLAFAQSDLRKRAFFHSLLHADPASRPRVVSGNLRSGRALMRKKRRYSMLKTFVGSLCAGILITIGGSVFLACEDKAVGAVFFSVALLCICYLGYYLYTGRIGYLANDHTKKNVAMLGVGLLGNLVSTFLLGLVIRYALPALGDKAFLLCTAKLEQSFPVTFIRAVFCGILMYLAVEIFKEKKTPIGIIFCIPVFILSGFEHSVADMFYFGASGIFSWNILSFELAAVLGNTAGSLILPLLGKIGAKRE